MGTSHSAELFEDQDSVSEPGAKSIISASLEDIEPPISEKELIDELLHIMRYPVDPVTEAVLKSVDVKELSPDAFIVKVTLDGKKLDSFGYGRGDGMDRIRNWKKVTVDRSKHKVFTEDFVEEAAFGSWADEASDNQVYFTTGVYFLSEPMRLEFCVSDKDGQRQASAGVRDVLYAWTDTIIEGIQSVKTAKVKVNLSGPSIKEKGLKSNLSEPMDAHVDYDNFFASMVALIKENVSKLPDCKVTNISDTEFEGTSTKPGEDGTEKVTRSTVKFSSDTGDVVNEIWQDGKLARTTFYTVHQSPLIVEAWGMDPSGERVTGEATGRQLQKMINAAVEKANSWFG